MGFQKIMKFGLLLSTSCAISIDRNQASSFLSRERRANEGYFSEMVSGDLA